MTNRHQTYIGSVGLAETRGLESLKITEVKRISDGMRRRRKITKASGNRRRLVKDEIAVWLDGFQWDWFSTYTLNMQARPDTAHTMLRNHLTFIEKHASLPLYAFRGDEYGFSNGRYHIHALLGNVGDFPAYCGKRLPARSPGDKPRPCCGVHSWPGGYARVFPYDPAISATGYVSKYVTKNVGNCLPRHRGSAIGTGGGSLVHKSC